MDVDQEGNEPPQTTWTESEVARKRRLEILSTASHGPLNLVTFNLLGMNRDALQIFAERFERDMTDTAYVELILLLAKERLERAILIESISGHHKYSDPQVLGDIPDEKDIVEGAVVAINRKEGRVIWVAPLYIRQHLVQQLRAVNTFMDLPDKQQLYVFGAPGCGKTCFFWMYAGILMKLKQRVLFIQYRVENQGSQVWVLENGEMRQLMSPKLIETKVTEELQKLLEARSDKFDVCICDGMIADDITGRSLRSLLISSSEFPDAKLSKLILVTSMQLHMTSGQGPKTKLGNILTVSFDSWRKEDFDKAAMSTLVKNERVRNILMADWTSLAEKSGSNVSMPPTLDQNQILEIVRQKYDYAGGCARYMFEMDLEDLEQCLDSDFERVQDKLIFAQTKLASKTPDAVNSLMQQFTAIEKKTRTSWCTPVSKYVLCRAYESCRKKLTNAFETVARVTDNPVLHGWAFELGQLDKIREALEGNLEVLHHDPKSTHLNAVVNSMVAFFPRAEATFDGSYIVRGDVESGAQLYGV